MSVPVNPFDILPLQPNIGRNRNFNQSVHNPNDYTNHNLNYPFDNTRTTFPPFDGSTRRPTLPTRRIFANFPPPTPPLGDYLLITITAILIYLIDKIH